MFNIKPIVTVVLLFVVVITSSGFMFMKPSQKKLDTIINEGGKLISGINLYVKDHNKYPERVSDIYPKYVGSFAKIDKEAISPDPETACTFIVDGKKFIFYTIAEERTKERFGGDKYRYGYHLSSLDLGLFSSFSLVYDPSEKYPERKYEQVHDSYRGWALVYKKRQYGNPNVIVNGRVLGGNGNTLEWIK